MALTKAVIEGATAIVGLELRVDGYPTESHELRANITMYPIESGAELTDHSVDQPDKLILTGWASSARQIGALGFFETDIDQPRRTWYVLNQMKRRKELLTIRTTIGTYSNMIIRKLSANIDSSTGQNLPFTAEFQEVLLRDDVGTFRDPAAVTGPTAQRLATNDQGRVTSIDQLEQQLTDALETVQMANARGDRLEDLEDGDFETPGMLSILTFGLVG